tara:strand:+ start:2814 stop:2993 length:180 start_codon:yes stop_codon:yes gene_type:complete
VKRKKGICNLAKASNSKGFKIQKMIQSKKVIINRANFSKNGAKKNHFFPKVSIKAVDII